MTADPATMVHRLAALGRALGEVRSGDTAIARAPKDEVWSSAKTRLYRYRPEKPPKLGPVLLVHGLIGRQTMTDLQPNRSLVRRLLAARVDTWVVDWGNASRADRFRDFADYADHGIGDCVTEIRRTTGADRVTLFGICQGGTFALCHAALNPERIMGLALAIAPVDFHADTHDDNPGRGVLNLWLRSLPRELLLDVIAEHGNLPGRLTGAVFQNLTPARTLEKYTTGLLGLAEDREALLTFLRMERWLADRPDHPGAAAREWLIDLYQENRLAEDRFEVDGRPVRLAEIACPVLNIYGTDDHIIPPPCSTALRRLLPEGHDYQEVAIPTGHVGVFVSRRAIEILPPAVIGWLARIA